MASVQSYRETARYKNAVAAFLREASQDPTLVEPVPQAKATIDGSAASAGDPVASTSKVPYSLVYHQTLASYVEQLTSDPSEGLSLASYCQHIRRWEIPRSSYPEGLAGYKSWRFKLNKFHTAEAFKILQESGYSEDEDQVMFITIENLLQKKTLKGGDDKSSDEKMQIFEDAICLTFLQLEFAEFMAKHDEEKMINIVQKTWKKMGHRGRDFAVQHLASQLPPNAQELLSKALAG
ncbi:hypothetical protein P389DRAFT_193907 [Cystobasidium minutum MCA 4210]|uniref:uncharacterized protein n=1 Tax=Cystobasidium minutum MCA 4210 TaxID=1397322 RepID=UPI0034D00709|eukprot:jgi/Rhomi1/193907/gm1.2121_g